MLWGTFVLAVCDVSFFFFVKVVFSYVLFAETEKVNSDDSTYNNMLDTTTEWKNKIKPFSQSKLNDLV